MSAPDVSLKLKFGEVLSNISFNFNWRRYSTAPLSLVYLCHIGFSIAIWGSVVGCGAYMAWALFFVSFFLAVCHTGYMVYTFFKIPDAGMVLEVGPGSYCSLRHGCHLTQETRVPSALDVI